MKRTPLVRRTPLARHGPLQQRAPARPADSTVRPRRPRTSPVPHDLRSQILERDGYRCVRCGLPAFGARGSSLHHRQPRGMGGRLVAHTAANLVTLCGTGTTGCHGWAESHRRDAAAVGLLVPTGADPATTSLLRTDGWYLPGVDWIPVG